MTNWYGTDGAFSYSDWDKNIKRRLKVLCSIWKDDGSTVFSGGCDEIVKMCPLLSGGQPTQVAAHDAPVKEVAWIEQMNLLVMGSWDKTSRYWDLKQAQPLHTQQLPVLCSIWKDDGSTVFSGGCAEIVKMWTLLSGGQPSQVAAHDAPVKEVAWIVQMNLLVMGSWDRTLRYWDLRQAQPLHTQQLPERCYALTDWYP